MQTGADKPSWWQRLWNTTPAVDPIPALMYQRMQAVQRGEFDPIGTIRQIQTEAGWIVFPPNRGPALGRFHVDSQIDMLDAWEWNGLPDTFELTDELCPDCQSPCDECREIGPNDHLFMSRKILICGQEKVFPPGMRPCIYGTQISSCGGSGVIAMQDNASCPTCGGSGQVECKKCRATGFMSTGKDAAGKMCASCGGSGRKRIMHEQLISQHLAPVHPGLYIGPIFSLMLTGPDKATEVWAGRLDDEGNLPHLVSKQFNAGSRVLILGGVLRLQHKTSALRRGRESRL